MKAVRLPASDLFHLRGPDGIEDISDATLDLRISEAERRAMRDVAPAYPELLEHPEVM